MRSAFYELYASSALRGGGSPRSAFTRRRPYMPLCTGSEVYIRLVCPGIGLSHGAATTRVSRRRPKSQHAAGSKFAFERPMGGSLLDVLSRNAALASGLQAASAHEMCARVTRWYSTVLRLLVLLDSGDSASNAHLRETTTDTDNNSQLNRISCCRGAVTGISISSPSRDRLTARPVDAARESARDQFEEEQAAQRRAHLLIFSAPSVIILAHRRRTSGEPGC